MVLVTRQLTFSAYNKLWGKASISWGFSILKTLMAGLIRRIRPLRTLAWADFYKIGNALRGNIFHTFNPLDRMGDLLG